MSFFPEGYTKVASTPIYKHRYSGDDKIDFNTILFRCSHLDKLASVRYEYSQALLNLYHQVVNNVEWVFETEAMKYGTEHEQEAIDLVNRIRGTQYVKSDTYKSNEYIEGHCDIQTDTHIIDIKCPTEKTFDTITYKKALRMYKKQLIGYCWLYGKKYAQILFCNLKTGKIKKFEFEVTESDIELLKQEITGYRRKFSEWDKIGITSPQIIPF